jgi:hypothetical protein
MLNGSFKITGSDILDKSLPIALRKMLHKLISDASGAYDGKARRLFNMVCAKSSSE